MFNHCDVIGLQSYRIRWKNTQNKGYNTLFKVTDVGTNRKTVCDFLLVINSITNILSRTVLKLSQTVVLMLDTNEHQQ